jgi:hypothetical protein
MTEVPLTLNPCPSLLDEADETEEEEEEDESDPTTILRNPQELYQRYGDWTHRLAQIRSQRRHIFQYQHQCDDHLLLLQHRWNHAQYRHDENLQTVVSKQLEIIRLQNQLENLKSYNLLSFGANDAFHIDFEQQTATINGLRLGINCSKTTTTNSLKTSNPETTQRSSSNSSTGGSSFFSWTLPSSAMPFSTTTTTTTNTDAAAAPTNQNQMSTTTTAPSTSSATATAAVAWKIPWREINAAFGQVALLLVILREQLLDHHISNNNNSIILFRYRILPMGSTSKIGINQNHSTTTTMVANPKQQQQSSSSSNYYYYNLFYSEENRFPFFAKRQFVTAMQYLFEHVYEMAHIMISQDRSILLPHAMIRMETTTTTTSTSSTSQWTIGGLSSSVVTATFPDADTMVDWTRVMKYLLTNMKYLQTFRGGMMMPNIHDNKK